MAPFRSSRFFFFGLSLIACAADTGNATAVASGFGLAACPARTGEVARMPQQLTPGRKWRTATVRDANGASRQRVLLLVRNLRGLNDRITERILATNAPVPGGFGEDTLSFVHEAEVGGFPHSATWHLYRVMPSGQVGAQFAPLRPYLGDDSDTFSSGVAEFAGREVDRQCLKTLAEPDKDGTVWRKTYVDIADRTISELASFMAEYGVLGDDNTEEDEEADGTETPAGGARTDPEVPPAPRKGEGGIPPACNGQGEMASVNLNLNLSLSSSLCSTAKLAPLALF